MSLLTLKPKWSEFIPPEIKPTDKQLAFMMLPHREALYGGAAGSNGAGSDGTAGDTLGVTAGVGGAAGTGGGAGGDGGTLLNAGETGSFPGGGSGGGGDGYNGDRAVGGGAKIILTWEVAAEGGAASYSNDASIGIGCGISL